MFYVRAKHMTEVAHTAHCHCYTPLDIMVAQCSVLSAVICSKDGTRILKNETRFSVCCLHTVPSPFVPVFVPVSLRTCLWSFADLSSCDLSVGVSLHPTHSYMVCHTMDQLSWTPCAPPSIWRQYVPWHSPSAWVLADYSAVTRPQTVEKTGKTRWPKRRGGADAEDYRTLLVSQNTDTTMPA